jgi:hypothetical protein
MADQFDNNARSPHPDAEIDDPLAELARIIGYERPSEDTVRADETSESSEFDLEAELMRELDVPQAPSIDELDRMEADEALDAMLADADFDREPEQVFQDAGRDGSSDLQVEYPVDDVPALDSADFLSVEGRSSDALLKAIESEFPVGQGVDHDVDPGTDEPVDDDAEWMLASDFGELVPDQPADAQEPDAAHAEQAHETIVNAAWQEAVAGPVTVPADDGNNAIGDEVLADMVRFDLRSKPSIGWDSADVSTVTAATQPDVDHDEAALDFEEYLSTELDVFKQEVEIGGNRDDPDDAVQPGAGGDVSDFDVETALDALNDARLDDEVAVFDDAAEELLAAINDDVEFSSMAASAAGASRQGSVEWSLDSIEEAAADELDDELGDLFSLPERAAEPLAVTADSDDDFELDLEQVLADSFDGSDDDWAEPLEVEAKQPAEPVVEAYDWLSGSPAPEQPVQRDELAEAFLGLVPEGDDQAVQAAPVSREAGKPAVSGAASPEPDHGDWLDGFDTNERPVASHSDSDDYYFDAELVSDADEAVEIVTEIDVPELAHDEPQPFEPDYETEIEREFADIIDRDEPGADERPVDTAGAVFGLPEDWSRSATASRGYEVSDDYIALERELGAVAGPAAYAAATAAHAVGGRGGEGDVSGATTPQYERADNGSRGPVVAVAVLGLALLAGVAAFGWSMLSGDETTADGGPRIIRADKDPVKVLPENPGGVTVPNQDKAVYDRVAGGDASPTGQPALVNTAEEPVDVVQRTLDPEILPLEGRSDFAVKSEERLSADSGGDEIAPNGAAAPVVSPRKVRTMIVKPDGSIVAREVPEPEASAPEPAPQTLAAASPEPAPASEPVQAPQLAEQQPAAETAPAEPELAPGTDVAATEGTVAPVRVVKTQQIRPVNNAPVPQGRPADQPVNVVGTVSQEGRVGAAPAAPALPATPAAAEPVAVASAPAAAAPAANPGGYYVQIASQPTAEGAQASWRTLSGRYSSVLGGFGVDIQRADIPGKGVFHRVRVPAGSRDQANALCTRYKAAGGSCFVSR